MRISDRSIRVVLLGLSALVVIIGGIRAVGAAFNIPLLQEVHFGFFLALCVVVSLALGILIVTTAHVIELFKKILAKKRG